MINYYLLGGLALLQDMQQQVILLVQAAMQGDLQANQSIKLIMDAALKGDQLAMQVALLIQAVVKQMQSSRKARLGAKLEYFKCGGKKKSKKLEQGNAIDLFKKKQALYKNKDLATRDSIAANRYNDQDVLINRPGSYKKNAKGQVLWTPDRTKYPYNKTVKH